MMPRNAYFARLLVGVVCLAQAGANAQPSVVTLPGPLRTLDQNGWTVLQPELGAQFIYVSSSAGDDANDGLSEEWPVRSLARGYELLRDGAPDWLLLRRGDQWNTPFPAWDKSGASAFAPLVIASYGSSSKRPRVVTGGPSAIRFDRDIQSLCLVGLEFAAESVQPNGAGLNFTFRNARDILIEGCLIEGFSTGLVVTPGKSQSTFERLAIRRCAIVDSFSPGAKGHIQGAYFQNVTGLLLDECLFDHNGRGPDEQASEATIFRHNVYIQKPCEDVVIRGCIFANASSHGVQLRPGGLVEGNLFIHNPIGLLIGGGGTGTKPASAQVHENVFLDGWHITPRLLRGWGMALTNVDGVQIRRNIVAGYDGVAPGQAFRLTATKAKPLRNILIEHNVVAQWFGAVFWLSCGSGETLDDVKVIDNGFQVWGPRPAVYWPDRDCVGEVTFLRNAWQVSQLNNFWSLGGRKRGPDHWKDEQASGGETFGQGLPQEDAPLSIEAYQAAAGRPATLESFLASVRGQAPGSWNAEFTANAVRQFLLEQMKGNTPWLQESPNSGQDQE